MNIPIKAVNAGELSPKVDARSDVEKYGKGCRHLENMLPTIYGGAERRPGTPYIAGYTGDAETAGKIHIYTLAQLALIGVDDDYPMDGDYELMNDIDASDTETWEWGDAYDSEGWLPMGETGTVTPRTPFTGTFDGRHHTISNLYINHGNPYVAGGLFGRIAGGTVENLRLSNLDYRISSSGTGGFVGTVVPTTAAVTIRECYTQGTIAISEENTGIIGGFLGSLEMSSNLGDALIEECWADVDIAISDIFQRSIGGFVGAHVEGYSGSHDAVIQNCYATGNITGSTAGSNSDIGGFIGKGGIYGHITVENCYSNGQVPHASETYDRGGFLGQDTGTIVITSCYYDEDLSNSAWSDGGTEKTNAEMKQEATFVDWDFDDIWEIVEDVSSPTLIIGRDFHIPNTTVRMIPFIYSATIAYKVELGDRYMRFIYDDDVLTDDNSREVTIDTPYSEDDIFELQYKQLGDTMWIVHEDYPQMKLTRTSATAFLLQEIEFKRGPFLTRNDLIDPDESGTATMTSDVADYEDTGTLTCSVAFFESGHVGALFKLVHPREDTLSEGELTGSNTGIICAAIDVEGTFNLTTKGNWEGIIIFERSENGADWEKFKQYKSIKEMGIGSGNLQYTGTENEENVQFRANMTEHVKGTITADITVNESMVSGIVKVTSIESTTVANIEVLKKLDATNYADATRRWAEGAWSPLRKYPSTITFFENRCVYGGMRAIPIQV